MDKVLGNVVCRLVAGVVGGLLRTGTSFALYEKFAQDIYTRLRTLFFVQKYCRKYHSARVTPSRRGHSPVHGVAVAGSALMGRGFLKEVVILRFM